MSTPNKLAYQEESDENIFNAYKQHKDMNAIAFLFEKYKTLIFGVCLKYSKNTTEAEDRTANIFELMMKRALKHEVKNFKSWLYVLVKNKCLEAIRKNQKNLTIATDPNFMHSFNILHQEYEEEDQIYVELRKCMGKLVHEQRRCIELLYEQKKSYKEIATLLDIGTNTARSYIQNARRNLKKCMQAKGIEK